MDGPSSRTRSSTNSAKSVEKSLDDCIFYACSEKEYRRKKRSGKKNRMPSGQILTQSVNDIRKFFQQEDGYISHLPNSQCCSQDNTLTGYGLDYATTHNQWSGTFPPEHTWSDENVNKDQEGANLGAVSSNCHLTDQGNQHCESLHGQLTPSLNMSSGTNRNIKDIQNYIESCKDKLVEKSNSHEEGNSEEDI